MVNDFIEWLDSELNNRGWGYNELARRAGLSGGAVSHVMNRRNNPGYDFCIKVAQALDNLPEQVLRRAGLLPPLPPRVAEEMEILSLVRKLSLQHRQAALAMLHGLAGQVQHRSHFDLDASESVLELLSDEDKDMLQALFLQSRQMDKAAWQRVECRYSELFDATPDALKPALIYGMGQAMAEIIRSGKTEESSEDESIVEGEGAKKDSGREEDIH